MDITQGGLDHFHGELWQEDCDKISNWYWLHQNLEEFTVTGQKQLVGWYDCISTHQLHIGHLLTVLQQVVIVISHRVQETWVTYLWNQDKLEKGWMIFFLVSNHYFLQSKFLVANLTLKRSVNFVLCHIKIFRQSGSFDESRNVAIINVWFSCFWIYTEDCSIWFIDLQNGALFMKHFSYYVMSYIFSIGGQRKDSAKKAP